MDNPYQDQDGYDRAWADGFREGQLSPDEENPTPPAAFPPYDVDEQTLGYFQQVWLEGHLAGRTAGVSADLEEPESEGGGGPRRVKLWLKVFIPGDAPGTIDGVGASAGHRVLQGPVTWFNDCFWTDSRDFSASISATCRMHSECVLDLTSGAGSGWVHYCGETHECDCEDGDIECTETASTSNMHWTDPWWHAEGVLAISLSGAANNPCFSGSPDIDYEGTYYIDLNQRELTFQGNVNGFPAYESYAEFDGSTVTVFNYGPRGTPGDLTGSAADAIDETVSF